MIDSIYIILIPVIPLLSFLLIGIVGRTYFPKYCAVIGTLSLFSSFAISATVAYQYFFEIGKVAGVYQKIIAYKMVWLQFSPNVSIDMGILLDPISVMMLLVVTFISFMVHLYSIGYMHDDTRISTYYSFLSLFSFSMLGLVLSTNIFQIYIFWELVGVSSFLLIGHYYEKPSAVAASKKAFIVTRFADLGFLIGILVLSWFTETLDFQTLIERLTNPHSPHFALAATTSFMGISALTWGLVLVFAGGAGKSAMFPFHIWLPDAMEGPTPVSALIHAATMVVAGVYLVARLFPVFSLSCPPALEVVAYIGAFSSLMAAIIACTQTDIKRVLAYSTMSQIGFMMFALGVSGYGGENGLGFMGSMFHLFTHSMFKALLFLGAGAVIHSVHSNEMKDMGGLRKKLPITHITFLIACLAIAGIPPFSGFFSKEEILLAAFNSNKLIFIVGIITAALTAFYMFRLYFSIFWNKEMKEQHAENDPHSEAPKTMLITLLILAFLSIVTGFIPFGKFVSSDSAELISELHVSFSVVPVLLALGGILLAALFYRKESLMPQKFSEGLGVFYRSAYKKFYFDELYLFVTKGIVFNLIGQPAAWFDKNIINGGVNLVASTIASISEAIKKLQSGKVQDYAIYFFAGTIGFVLLFIYLWK